MTEEELEEKIRREREALGCKPWEFAPSEVDDGPNPYPPGTAGHASWERAQALRAQLRAAKKRNVRN